MSSGEANVPVGAIRNRLSCKSALPASTTMFCWRKVAPMVESVSPNSASWLWATST